MQGYISYKKTKQQEAIAAQNRMEAKSARTSKAAGQTLQQPIITLYGTGWCGYCVAARSFFKANGIAYTDLDVEKSKEDYNSYRKFGKKGIPVITIDNDVIEGFDEDEIRKKLDQWLNKA
ncbi:glutaredoxin family protein [Undibacterium sp. JH2W]|uniref:glutaredoxin family protein n=1 Tax=Undibacterium sp. JH2W TaxID=3413037 RepID=UPI003BF525CB